MAIDVDKTLQQVVRQLEAERGLLDQRIAAVRVVVDGSRSTSVAEAPRRRRMSPAARREVSRRMKRYWAKRRAGDTKAGAARTQEAARAGQEAPKTGPRRSRSNKTVSRKKTASRAATKRRARAKATKTRANAATSATQA